MGNRGQQLLVPGKGKSGLVLPITSGLAVWFNGDTLAGANGSLISSWTDSSGNGITATATGSNRPSILTNWLHGTRAATFDGASDYLSASLSLNQPGTVFIVAQYANTSAGVLLDGQSSTTRWTLYQVSAGKLEAFAGTSGTVDVLGTLTNPFIAHATFNGATSGIALNGTAGTTGNPGSNNLSGLRIGTRYDTLGNWAAANIAQVIFYNRVLSGAELAKIDHALGAYYGIAVTD